MSTKTSLATLIVVATVAVATMAAGPVAAHESQEIEGYKLTFGGSDEPVITGERMWLQLRIVDGDGEPVAEQADGLEWRLEKPGEVDPIVLDASEKHGDPGVYEAAVVFTEPGEYVLHVEGTLEGTEIHTHFEKEVEDRTALKYPESQESEAAGFGIGPDLGIGLAIGAIGVVVAFLLGRRFTSTSTGGPEPGPAK